MQFQMLDRQRLGQAEHEGSLEMSAGGFILAATEDDIVIVQTDGPVSEVLS